MRGSLILVKIAYIVSTLRRSGPINQLFYLLKYIDRNIYKPYLITLSPEAVNSSWTDFKELNCDIHSIGLSRLKGVFHLRSKLHRIIDNIKPNIIHSQGLRADFWLARYFSGYKIISTLHNHPNLDYDMTYGTVKGKVMSYLHAKSLNKLDQVIGVSQSVSKNLIDKYKINQVSTINNGIDINIFNRPTGAIKKNVRYKLNLPEDANIWLSLGHLSKLKNPLFLIEHWKSNYSGNHTNHLVIVGSGPLNYKCKIASVDVPNIHLPGYVTNVEEYLKSADYFLSASKAEGMPNAILEALACGLPVILSDIPPHRDIMKMGSLIGSLFEIDSHESLNIAIKMVKDAAYTTISDNCLYLVKNRLNAKLMSAEYQKIYRKVLEEPCIT